MNLIRKVNLGIDYKDSMCYSVGQVVFDKHTIVEIIEDGNGNCLIYIQKNGEAKLWKKTNASVGITLEYNLDY